MSAQRDFGLDVVRCLAIGGVLAMHAAAAVPSMPPYLSRVFYEGWVGVDIFFVLSGYLIGSQASDHAADASPLRSFWLRRWTRTLPLYFFVLFVYLAVKPRLFDAPFQGETWRFFLFLQNFFPISDFAQSWSLCLEEQFYLFFPLLFYPVLKGARVPWLWVAFWLLGPAVRTYQWWSLGLPAWGGDQHGVPQFDLAFRFHTLAHIDGLAAGVFLSATREHWQRWPLARLRACGVVGAALLAAVCAWTSYAPGDLRAVLMFSGLSLGAAGLVVGAYRMPRPSGPVAGWVVSRVALWSYGTYLWNPLLLRFFTHHPVAGPWVGGVLLFLLASHAVSALTYYLVERPGLRSRRRLLRSGSV